MKRIVIVGVGGLGSAMAKGVVRSGIDPSQLVLVDRKAEHGVALECPILERLPQGLVLGPGDLLVLAVKPQDAEAACLAVRASLGRGSLVLSVMAGIPVERLYSWLAYSKVSRAMPNLGVGVCQSATAYWVPVELEPVDISLLEQFLACMGRSWRLENEELIDAVTAVAGSGPAYMCWLLEQMEGVARELGLSDATSRGLVMQTLKATTCYLEHFDQTCSELRCRVTSPGGTTAAALNVLNQTGSHDTVRQAIRAAFDRAREMGQ